MVRSSGCSQLATCGVHHLELHDRDKSSGSDSEHELKDGAGDGLEHDGEGGHCKVVTDALLDLIPRISSMLKDFFLGCSLLTITSFSWIGGDIESGGETGAAETTAGCW